MNINWSNLFTDLSRQEFILGLFFLAVGLVFLLWGLRIYRILVVISLMAIGVLVVLQTPLSTLVRILLAVPIALLLCVVGWRLAKVSVAVLTSVWAAFVIFTILEAFDVRAEISLVLSLVAVGVVISLIFILFEQIIALVTSFEGALLCVIGLVNLAGQSPRLWELLQPMLLENLFFTPFLVVAITFTGFYFQMAELTRKKTGMSG